jgi:hypothetical protein
MRRKEREKKEKETGNRRWQYTGESLTESWARGSRPTETTLHMRNSDSTLLAAKRRGEELQEGLAAGPESHSLALITLSPLHPRGNQTLVLTGR